MSPERGKVSSPSERWGTAAPTSIRIAAIVAWASLVARLLSASLPGSRSGIESLIRRADTVSSVLSQGVALIGGSQLALLVVQTVSERTLSPVYRCFVTLPAGIVLLLVMFSCRMPLEPQANLALGVTCLTIAGAGAAVSLRESVARAHALVLLAITFAAAIRLGIHALDATPHLDAAVRSKLPLLAAVARALDLLGVSLAAVRWVAERRTVALLLVLFGLAASTIVAWGAIRGSFDGASLWQVLASRALGDLTSTGGVAATSGGYAVDAFALTLAGIVVCFPARLSWGLVCLAFALLGKPGADVPTAALLIALSGLMAPMSLGKNPGKPAPLRTLSVSQLVLIIATALVAISGCQRPEKSPVVRGQGVFLRSCAGCHGANARGANPAGFSTPPKDLTDPALQARLSDADLAETIRKGKGQMPAFGAALPQEDVDNVVAYVRSLK